VSVAYAPAGRVGAHGSVRMNVTVDLLDDRLARVMNGTGLLFGQEYGLDTYTESNGTVNVLGIIRKDIGIRLESGAASTVQSKGLSCLADVTIGDIGPVWFSFFLTSFSENLAVGRI
jgi:hypothetical protein